MQVVLKDLETRMNAAIDVLSREFAGVRTGRASAGLLDSIRVDYYGNATPISQMASVSVPDARTLMIQPWEAAQLKEIEKAIMKSDLGIQPVNDGKVIRLNMPTPTEERRKQLVKKVNGLGEEAKTAVRLLRREANDELKKLQKDGKLAEDDARRATDDVQKKTDKYVAEIEAFCKNKEKELMEV
jgi:ribosome recycling factor